MSSTREDQKLTAKEREEREHQESIKRYANASAVRVMMPIPNFRFIRIDDAEQIERLKQNIVKAQAITSGPAGSVTTSNPCVVTNVDDKDGTFQFEENGKIRPNYLIYVSNGIVTSSVPTAKFAYEDAQILIAKALEMGKDLVLHVGANHQEPNWAQQAGSDGFHAKRALKQLDMMIKAANAAGQPYTLGKSAKALLRYFKNPDLEARYIQAETNAAANATARNLVAEATKDAVLTQLAISINDLNTDKATKISDATAFTAEVGGMTTLEEKLQAIAERLKALQKRAEKTDEAAKQIKSTAEGAVKLLTEVVNNGAAMFQSANEPADEHNAERRIQVCESAVNNVKDRFGGASARTNLEAVVNKTNTDINAQVAACQALLTNIKTVLGAGNPAHKQVSKLQSEGTALSGRVAAADRALTDATNEAGKVAGLATAADKRLKGDKQTFDNTFHHPPKARL